MSRRPEHRRTGKRGRIGQWPDDAPSPEDVAALVTYVGNPIHKTYPSPAGPAALKADETKCARYEWRDWPKLREALQSAIRAQCVSGEFRGQYPSRAWAWVNDVLHEAKLTGEGQGEYHGFPLDDPKQYPLPEEQLELAPRVTIP